jgi:UDP-glucose 4-epimerase
MARILVTGATGFIGAHLCRTLAVAGEYPIAAARAPARDLALEQRVTGDLADLPQLDSLLNGVDAVVHLAGRAHVMQETAEDPEQAFHRANAVATAHLARAAAAAGVQRFVFLSSVKVNGEATFGEPFRETDAPAPQDAYGRSKWAAEQALWRTGADTGLEVVVIRPPLVYGPGVKANFLRLMRLVDRALPLPLGALPNRRSLINLDNLGTLILAALHHPDAAGHTFLASDQHDLSTPQLIRLLASALHRPTRLLRVPPPLLAAGARILRRESAYARLAGSLQVDSSLATRVLGWRPATSPVEALRITADWYRGTAG